MSLQEAAEHLGIHPKTVRQRIKDGKLPARKFQGPRGPEWRVYPNGIPSTDPTLTVDSPSVDGPWTEPVPTVDSPSVQGEAAIVLEALRLVDSLRRENEQLAGQLGFTQAKLQEAERTVALLMAPKDEPEPPAEPERRPWWKRLWG
jgi:excisionase family DNA binding protein